MVNSAIYSLNIFLHDYVISNAVLLCGTCLWNTIEFFFKIKYNLEIVEILKNLF